MPSPAILCSRLPIFLEESAVLHHGRGQDNPNAFGSKNLSPTVLHDSPERAQALRTLLQTGPVPASRAGVALIMAMDRVRLLSSTPDLMAAHLGLGAHLKALLDYLPAVHSNPHISAQDLRSWFGQATAMVAIGGDLGRLRTLEQAFFERVKQSFPKRKDLSLGGQLDFSYCLWCLGLRHSDPVSATAVSCRRDGLLNIRNLADIPEHTGWPESAYALWLKSRVVIKEEFLGGELLDELHLKAVLRYGHLGASLPDEMQRTTEMLQSCLQDIQPAEGEMLWIHRNLLNMGLALNARGELLGLNRPDPLLLADKPAWLAEQLESYKELSPARLSDALGAMADRAPAYDQIQLQSYLGEWALMLGAWDLARSALHSVDSYIEKYCHKDLSSLDNFRRTRLPGLHEEGEMDLAQRSTIFGAVLLASEGNIEAANRRMADIPARWQLDEIELKGNCAQMLNMVGRWWKAAGHQRQFINLGVFAKPYAWLFAEGIGGPGRKWVF